MRNREAALSYDGFRRLAWVLLGASLLTLLMLAWPSPAQAQITPVCPSNGPGPAPPHTSCRPLCETPASTLTVDPGGGLGSGSVVASALNPYGNTSGPYDTRGEPDCAEQVETTDVWNVKRFCGFHCVHWHTQIPTYGVPVAATALATPTPTVAGVDYFTGWSSNCAPSATKTVNRNVCSIVMNSDKDIVATFALAPDGVPPGAPVLSKGAVRSYDVTLNWTKPIETTWLGGFEIYRAVNGGVMTLYSRVGPTKTSAKLINQFCQTNYTFEVRAFDSANETPSNSVAVRTGKCVPATRPNTILHVWPPKTTRSRTAYFHWAANRSPVRYQCKLDRQKKWKKCFPGKTYKRLKPGKHMFRARAYDAAGADKTPATYRWTIRR